MKRSQSHVIYGLYLASRPRVILYVGSSVASRYPERLQAHQSGCVPTTRKAAEKHGLRLKDLRGRILRYWNGPGASPEGHTMRLMRAFGLALWNFPYVVTYDGCRRGGITRYLRHGNAFSLEDNRRGGKNTPKEIRRNIGLAQAAKHEGPFAIAEYARLGALAANARRTPDEASAVGRKGGMKGGPMRAHLRWHVNRGISNPACRLCMEVCN
jgi:hypothetical protein